MDTFLFELPDLRGRDFTAHNEEVRALWQAFEARTHERIPVRFTCNPRMLILDPQYNTRGITYEDYMRDPEVMAEAGLEFQYWQRLLLPGDHEKGLPERWVLAVDFENHYDAAWFGCPVHYRDGQVPDTTPILDEDHKRMLFDHGVPDPFEGEWAERCLRFMEAYEQKCKVGWSFLGVRVTPPQAVPFMSCDGVFTIAASLRGPQALCVDLLADPEYARELLEYVYAAVSARMTAWRKHFGAPAPQGVFFTADDSIELISTELYREFVLPIHRRLFDAFGDGADRGIHLCGDAQRHFVTIHKELGVTQFDTGFPIDFGRFRRELGPDVLLSGGPPVPLFLEDESGPVIEAVERILNSGILEGGRFILQEANNLSPRSRLDVCNDFYETGKRLGVLAR